MEKYLRLKNFKGKNLENKIALILARGGSKGIPNKNIIDVSGKPLISYTITAALQSSVDDVWVSTDNYKIAEVSKKFGAKVIDRPAELAQDDSSSEPSLIHFLENVSCDILIFIQPTSPLLLSTDIDKGLDKIKSCDSVFSVYREHWIPRWTLDLEPDRWDPLNRSRRQDVQEKYVENGAFYISYSKKIIETNCRYSGKLDLVEMPMSRSIQVDTLDDLDYVKRFLSFNTSLLIN